MYCFKVIETGISSFTVPRTEYERRMEKDTLPLFRIYPVTRHSLPGWQIGAQKAS